MVAKISIGSSLYGALTYNQEKVDKEKGEVLAANLVRYPENGQFSIPQCMEDFQRCLPSHFRTEKPVIHISLNPHPDDKLTDEQLTKIGEEYMKRLGYGGQPYMIFKHSDIEREHIHIVSLRVDSEGKKINDKYEHRRSVEITKQLEKEFNLKPAQGKSKSENWQIKPIDVSKGDIKHQITNVLKPLAKMYHYQTMGEYKALLSLYNIGVETVKGEVKGKPYQGVLYVPLNKDGEKAGTPLKSSLFGKSYGYDKLQEKFSSSGTHIKNKKLRDKTLKIVSPISKNAKSEAEFKKQLLKNGIELFLRRNDTGRITGATFIDHNTRTVLNGSRLGKEFSANTFNERFNIPQHQEHIPFEEKSSQTFKHSDSKFENSIGGFFSLLPDNNSSQKGAPSLRPEKKKKKRRYGRQS